MPTPRKNDVIHGKYFVWLILKRDGTWYADGRSNNPSAGRHSLGVKQKVEALRLLKELDRVRAEDVGLIPRTESEVEQNRPIFLEQGRKLYEAHIGRPRVTGGVRASTKKRYRAVFDKFIPFAQSQDIKFWNNVTSKLLNLYAAFLENDGYAHKTLVNELTTLKQAMRWLIEDGHLKDMKPIDLKLRKAESQPAYCYRPQEVRAMLDLCKCDPELTWLGEVVTALACTGLRIAETASLRWSDIDFEKSRLTLTDETGRSASSNRQRRELKSGRSRSFPLHPDLHNVLKNMKQSDAYVFHGPRGGRLKPDTVRRLLIKHVIDPLAQKFPSPDGEQGFKDGRLHSFRHYFCSTCANNNVPERMVMDWLGHADSEMLRRYYHLHDEESRSQMNSLDFLGGPSLSASGDPEKSGEYESPKGEGIDPKKDAD